MDFSQRSTEPELMDSQCADYQEYARCLADLEQVNKLTLTHRPVLAWLAEQTRGLTAFSLLDVASGHGDLLRRIDAFARRRGLTARLEGIDLNPWCTEAARAATQDAGIRFHTGNVFDFEPEQHFDFIVSSQFLHHLTDEDVTRFILWQEAHADRGWFIADLHRHWFPYYGFGVLATVARWHRLIRYDGRVSIARAFKADELRRQLDAVGVQANVAWHLPFRLCVSRTRVQE